MGILRDAARVVPTDISTANEVDSNSHQLEINIFTVGDLDDISHQLELFFERVVPRTPRGTLDVDRCEREAVRGAVKHANANRTVDLWRALRDRTTSKAFAEHGGTEYAPMYR